MNVYIKVCIKETWVYVHACMSMYAYVYEWGIYDIYECIHMGLFMHMYTYT